MRIPALNSFVGVLIFILCFTFLVSSVHAEVINITASDDSFVNKSSPDTNYGNLDHLYSYFSGPINYAFLKFDVPEYTGNAYLHVYMLNGTKNANSYISAHTATSDWSENSITWNNLMSVHNFTSTDTVYVTSSAPRWVVFNVSSVVSYSTNYTFKLYDAYAKDTYYASSENSNVSLRPYLEIHTTDRPLDIIQNNKTNDDTKNFLVNTSECVQFSITADNISSCAWEVNKTAQADTDNTFNFTIPAINPSWPQSGIWEIRCNATYTNGSYFVREWLISGLTEEQAPDFIDYFTSLDNRFQPFKDPWGRSYYSYTGATTNLIADGYLTRTTTSPVNLLNTHANFPVKYGTYIFKAKSDLGGLPPNVLGFSVKNRFGIGYTIGEYHDYFQVDGVAGYTPISRNFMGEAPGNLRWAEDPWREIKVISTPDGWWYFYIDDALNPRAIGHFDNPNSPGPLSLAANSLIRLDCIEAYENQYIFPHANITYGSYPKLWYRYSDTYCTPKMHNGVIVDGRNITLQQISDTLNNESIVTYNTETKTATMKTNLFLKAGAELNVINETLLFDTTTESLFIRPDSGSTIIIDNSTISTTADNPLIWTFTSLYAQTVFNPTYNINGIQYENTLHRPIYNWRGRLIVENSTIDNSCNMFLQAPHELILNDTIFSNMSKSDDGILGFHPGYDGTLGDKGQVEQAKGKKSVRIVPAIDLANFSVNNISFVNPKEPITLENVGGQWIFNETVIENSDLSNIAITTKKAHKQEYHQNYKLNDEKGNLSLLNCLVNESSINVLTENATFKIKYYADVILKDASGNPVPNAIITPVASNESYRAENLYKYERYEHIGPGEGGVTGYESYPPDHPYYQHNFNYYGGDYIRWDNCLALGSAITNAAGRTALPSEDVNNSIVLTDKVWTNETGTQICENVTYNLTVNTTGYSNLTLEGVDPYSGWYRPDPETSKHTIVAVENSSSDVHLTGYAPAPEYNNFIENEQLQLKIWASAPVTDVVWKQGETVIEGENDLTCNITATADPVTVSFSGTTSSGTLTKEFLIEADPLPPVAEFSANNVSGSYPLYVNFTDESTGGNVDQWAWDFDNNGVIDSYSKNPRTKYKVPGTYTVKLTTSNGVGGDTETKTGYITVTGQNPTKKVVHSVWGYFWNLFYNINDLGA